MEREKRLQILAEKLARIDRDLKDVKYQLKERSIYHSPDQLKVFRIRRAKLNKERKQILIQIESL